MSESTPYSANGRSRETSSARETQPRHQPIEHPGLDPFGRAIELDAAHRPATPARRAVAQRLGSVLSGPGNAVAVEPHGLAIGARCAIGRGIRPRVNDFQFAGQVLIAAQAPLHLAAGGDRQRSLADQHHRVRIDFMMLDHRPANRLDDLVPVGVAELAVDLVHDHEPLGPFVFEGECGAHQAAAGGPPRPTARCPADSGCGRG